MKEINGRKTEYEILDIFLKRYSPRAFSGEAISKEELMTLFEAARWAPWRFIYAQNGTPEFDTLISTLMGFNKEWCIRASALIVTISHNNKKDGTLSPTHSFDAGAAWENLALQAITMGMFAHGMAGFDYAMVKKELQIPDDYTVEMMISLGKPGKIEDLPESRREGEKPSDRRPLEEIVFEGKFPN